MQPNGIEEKVANTIAHDHIHGNNDLESIIFMNKRLARTDVILSDGYVAQRTFYDFE